jgi:hypothetical protein
MTSQLSNLRISSFFAAALGAVICTVASAQQPAALAQATTAFRLIADTEDAEAAHIANTALANSDLTLEDWDLFFQELVETVPCNERLHAFWRQHNAGTSGAVRAVYAITLLERALASPSGQPPCLDPALTWAFATPDKEAQGIVRAALAEVLPSAVPLVGSTLDPLNSPELAIQVTRVLLDQVHAGIWSRMEFANTVGLQDAGLIFWNTLGVLVLDTNTLSRAQLSALGALLEDFPAYASAYRFYAAPGVLAKPASDVCNLPAASITEQSDPAAFGEKGPTAPRYIIEIAQQLVARLQTVQMDSRPGVRVHRDAVVHAGRRNAQSLRADKSPRAFRDAPEALAPSMAYTYFIDTNAAFQRALRLFRAGDALAMNHFMLIAEILSIGGGQVPLYRIHPDGEIVSAPSAVDREPLPEGTWNPIASLRINSFAYWFSRDSDGLVTKVEELPL